MSGIATHTRPPYRKHHSNHNTSCTLAFYFTTGRNYNRFSILDHSVYVNYDDIQPTTHGPSMKSIVKNAKSYCPPIVVTPTSTSKLEWTTVKNRKLTLRQLHSNVISAKNNASPKSVVFEHDIYNSNKDGVLIDSNKNNGPITTNKNKRLVINDSTRAKSKMYHNLPTKKSEKIHCAKNPKTNFFFSKMDTPSKDVTTIPMTPESVRRKKKQRGRDYAPQPPLSSKKKRPSKSKSPPTEDNGTNAVANRTRSNTPGSQKKSPLKSEIYVKINPGTDDDVIRKMSKSNLSQETSKIATFRKIALSKDVILNASKTVLVRCALAFKRLSKPLL